jgi:Beta-glucan synthesis-associated protein SKN1/KRE6/Sbg1
MHNRQHAFSWPERRVSLKSGRRRLPRGIDASGQASAATIHRCGRLRSTLLLSISCERIFLLVSFLLTFAIDVEANWIDPDTPMEVRTVTSYTARPYVAPPPKPSHFHAGSSNSSNSTQQHRRKTLAPTHSPEPTTAPTESPSPYPTLQPSNHVYELVFSDEFNVPDRTFADGNDPRWTALDKNDYTNDALHYYSPNMVRTNHDGQLVITSIAADTSVVGYDDVKRKRTHVVKHFKSAMIQSWNKFCFTGGIIEAEAILPGDPNVGGLWPAFWLLGNLARHT